ncbi:hypothetical protein [Pseudomonas brassicacearum]|uniref:hypothetical protein n=1 Tax=Pseudomonas brassicacearum TaxID=930166 RepID=UPI00273598C1|nr:hypothetical protein [Pseudomonas brassicacearum]WLG69319.1 hypothetical protein PSH71_05825 [Pseudomonas brassicacearum]
MAAKVEYVVIEGCVQDGAKLVRKGEVYVPLSTEIRDLLLEEGVIAKRGKLESGSSASDDGDS